LERYANSEFRSSPTKREFFDAVEDEWDQYEHDLHGWETLVERLLGLAEAYRKVHPIKASGVELEDNAGRWQDNL
jgi:hypothetical protein